MFDLGSEQEKEEMEKQKYQYEECQELSEKERLSMEKEMLGIYISGHPLEKLREKIIHLTNINTMDFAQIAGQMSEVGGQISETRGEISEVGSQVTDVERNGKPKFVDGQKVKLAGIITSIKKKYTKNNKIMAFITIEDLYGIAEVIAFENAVISAGNSLVEENIVLVDGRLSIREDSDVTIIANDIKGFGDEQPRVITFDITEYSEEQKDKLRSAIKYFSGDKNNMNVQVKVGEDIKPCGAIYYNDEVKKIFEDFLFIKL